MYHEIFLLDNFNHRCMLGCSMLYNVVSLRVFGCVRCCFKSAEKSSMREGGMNVCLSSKFLCQDLLLYFYIKRFWNYA